MYETNQIVTLQEAQVITHTYQNSRDFAGKTTASKISASVYQALIAQPGCEAVRTYFGLKDNTLTIVVVGVDAIGNDMTAGVILDHADNCPTKCSNVSNLMS